MSDVAVWIGAVGGAATAPGVLLAWWQLRASRKQARTAFEEDLTSQYRSIAAELPLAALLGDPWDEETMKGSLPAFYRYMDLCNEQVFLHERERVRDDTWEEWRQGIEGNFARPAFRHAWEMIDERVRGNGHDDFDQLRDFFEQISPKVIDYEDGNVVNEEPACPPAG